jgi:hypothetical protein
MTSGVTLRRRGIERAEILAGHVYIIILGIRRQLTVFQWRIQILIYFFCPLQPVPPSRLEANPRPETRSCDRNCIHPETEVKLSLKKTVFKNHTMTHSSFINFLDQKGMRRTELKGKSRILVGPHRQSFREFRRNSLQNRRLYSMKTSSKPRMKTLNTAQLSKFTSTS